jgi:hypothetical protein
LNLYTYWLKLNRYFGRTSTHTVKGIVVHSTGCNQPKIEPFTNVWNSADSPVCVHGIIGMGPQGFGAYQLIPWDKYVGGCGRGSRGSYNDSHIQFEICEDGLTDPAYFAKVYKEAVELCAYLCKQYSLAPSTIVCHSEACALGYASNHADVMHWFPRHGKTMDDFRADVKTLLEDENMTGEEIYNKFMEYAATLPESAWSVNGGSMAKAKAAGITDGTKPRAPLTREQAMAILDKIGAIK